VRSLSYTQPQIWVAIVFVVISVLLTAAFVAIGRSARREVAFEDVKRVGYGIRTWWLVGLATLLTVGVVGSLFVLPYSGARGATGPAQNVSVKGGQFYWTVSPNQVSAGRVKFAVTSADVNHGLGIYSPKGEMLGSVQAMPGYTNKLDVQLDEPGDYQLSCLELCGAGHDKMQAILKVAGG
jgi:cytochrome c oxidase subunit II